MKTRILILLIAISLLGNAQEKSPTLFVDGTPIAFESGISLPYWLSEGRSVEFGVHVISLSILEFNIVGNELQFSQVIHLTSSGSVPSSKVWKIEALGLGFTNESVITTNGFSTSETPTIFTSPITFTESATWIVPPSLTRVCIEVWSKGGDGGTGFGAYPTKGGNGGGGAYGYQCFSVTPGTVLNIVLDDTATSVNDLISASNGEDGVRASLGGNHGVGGTSSATYNIPGQNATSIQGGQGGNGGQGGLRSQGSDYPSAATFPGGGGGGGRDTGNVNTSKGTPGGGGQVIIYF